MCAFLREQRPSPHCRCHSTAAESADCVIGGSNVHQISSHKDLLVWQKSVTLASKVYRVTRELPDEERYGLTRQIRRAAVSVASNVAEGAARSRRREFIHFLNIARGSLTELETQVSIAMALNMLRPECQLEEDIREIGRMLTGLIRRLVEHRPVERVVRS
jgi:four helix bundle protein